MERQELIQNKDFLLSGMQLQLLNLIEDYMNKNHLKRKELADKLGVTKGYISQLLGVSFDHKISKIIELALACGTVPLLFFVEIDKFIYEDKKDKIFDLIAVQRPIDITYEFLKESPSIDKDNNQQLSIDFYLNRNDSYKQMEPNKSKTEAVIININNDKEGRMIS